MDVDHFWLKVEAGGVNGDEESKVDRKSIVCVEPHIVDDVWNYII